jgi:hypothetical protein
MLEYNTPVWSPFLKKDIEKIEKVQRYYTKRLLGLQDLSYLERLSELDLETLEERRIKYDLIAAYNIIKGNNDVDRESFFKLKGDSNTRGHPLQLKVHYTRLDIAKHFFANRVVQVWNDLPFDLLEMNSLERFKARIPTEIIRRHCKIYQ